MEASLSTLDETLISKYLELCIFPEDTPIPISTISILWNSENTENWLFVLEDLNLIQRKGNGYILHDLQLDFIRWKITSEMRPTIHQKFIENLKNSFKEFHLIPNDGYLFEHVAMHLWNVNLCEILHDLLLNFHWLQHQVAENQLKLLIGDYSYFSNDFEMTLIRKSLLLSSHVILSDKNQLESQLQARLVDFASSFKSVSSLLYSIDSTLSGTFWLKASKSILQSPNTSFIQTLVGHSSGVTTVSITPDGSKIISGSFDKTIKIWNINTGEELKTLVGHSSFVTTVSITPDGSKIISGSEDKTIKIWNINTGEKLKTLIGHSSDITTVSITPDGSKIIFCDKSEHIIVWSLLDNSVELLASFTADFDIMSMLCFKTRLLFVDIIGREFSLDFHQNKQIHSNQTQHTNLESSTWITLKMPFNMVPLKLLQSNKELLEVIGNNAIQFCYLFPQLESQALIPKYGNPLEIAAYLLLLLHQHQEDSTITMEIFFNALSTLHQCKELANRLKTEWTTLCVSFN